MAEKSAGSGCVGRQEMIPRRIAGNRRKRMVLFIVVGMNLLAGYFLVQFQEADKYNGKY